MIITIDGPTASGKSTLARQVASAFNCYYIYSGLLFRSLAYLLLKEKKYTAQDLSHPKEKDVNEILDPARFVYSFKDGKEGIEWDGSDISGDLKSPSIDQAASVVSVDKYVRTALMRLQRIIANNYDVVLDGRDTGSVVFPHADCKFYLTASDAERARRWQQVQAMRGYEATLQEALHQLKTRDERDSHRAHDPLIIPHDAIVIDNTNLNQFETLELIKKYIKKETRL